MDFDNDDRKKIADLIGRVREILANTLTENVEIKDILQNLDELGLKVNLNFIALVGNVLPELPSGTPMPFIFKDGLGFVPSGDLEFKLTDEDADFLKEIGIRFDDEEKE